MTETGVAVLLVYGAKIFPPRNGNPGIDVLVDKRGTIKLTAVDYPDLFAARTAIDDASKTCRDAGLVVQRIDPITALAWRKP